MVATEILPFKSSYVDERMQMTDSMKNNEEKKSNKKSSKKSTIKDEFRRPANEDDDGYDPYSDRPAHMPLYEEDPWK